MPRIREGYVLEPLEIRDQDEHASEGTDVFMFGSHGGKLLWLQNDTDVILTYHIDYSIDGETWVSRETGQVAVGASAYKTEYDFDEGMVPYLRVRFTANVTVAPTTGSAFARYLVREG